MIAKTQIENSAPAITNSKGAGTGLALTILLVALVFVFEFAAFRHYFDNYESKLYPAHFDQLDTYRFAYTLGMSLKDKVGAPLTDLSINDYGKKAEVTNNSIKATVAMAEMKGIVVDALALVSTMCLGVQRWSVCLVNFLFLLLGQTVLFFAMRATYGIRAALLASGLFLLSGSHYFGMGGLDDIRLDYAGMIMMGLTYLMATRWLRDGLRRDFIATVVCMIVSTMTRSIGLIYWLATSGLIFVILAVTAAALKADAIKQYRNRAFAMGAAAGVTCLIYLGCTWTQISGYYINCKVSGEDIMRRRENAVYDWFGILSYYPNSFFIHFQNMLAATGLIAFLPHAFRLIRDDWKPIERVSIRLPLLLFGCLALSVIACASLYVPSPLIIGVLTMPLSVALALVIFKLVHETCGRKASALVAISIAAVGLYSFTGFMGRRPSVSNAQSTTQIDRVLDEVADLVAARKNSTRLTWALVSEGLNSKMFELRWYEQRQRPIDTPIHNMYLAAFPAFNMHSFKRCLADTDVLIIPTRLPELDKGQFEYDGMAELRRKMPAITSVLQRDFDRIDSVAIENSDMDVSIFVRKTQSVAKPDHVEAVLKRS